MSIPPNAAYETAVPTGAPSRSRATRSWSGWRDSNARRPRPKRGGLPLAYILMKCSGPPRGAYALRLPATRLNPYWHVGMDLNHRSPESESGVLARLDYPRIEPYRNWWKCRESNPGANPCKGRPCPDRHPHEVFRVCRTRPILFSQNWHGRLELNEVRVGQNHAACPYASPATLLFRVSSRFPGTESRSRTQHAWIWSPRCARRPLRETSDARPFGAGRRGATLGTLDALRRPLLPER